MRKKKMGSGIQKNEYGVEVVCIIMWFILKFGSRNERVNLQVQKGWGMPYLWFWWKKLEEKEEYCLCEFLLIN